MDSIAYITYIKQWGDISFLIRLVDDSNMRQKFPNKP
jgi:hypothetical protein